LSDISTLPDRVQEFLTLPILDHRKTWIEVSVFSGYKPADPGGTDLEPLSRYLKVKSESLPSLAPVLTEVETARSIVPAAERAVALVRSLVHHRDALKDVNHQDDVIVFLHFSFRKLQELSSAQRETVIALVRQLDTQAQAEILDTKQVPSLFLEGNINIYPLALDNTFWHQHVQFAGAEPASPIMEVRFMGLHGLGRFLFSEYEAKSHLAFVHLDGETL